MPIIRELAEWKRTLEFVAEQREKYSSDHTFIIAGDDRTPAFRQLVSEIEERLELILSLHRE